MTLISNQVGHDQMLSMGRMLKGRGEHGTQMPQR